MPNVFTSQGLEQLSSAYVAMLADGGILSRCVWRDTLENTFEAGRGDTVTVRENTKIPAANFTGIATVSDIVQGKISVVIDQQPYSQVKITSKERTLYIEDLVQEVLTPQAAGVTEYIDQAISNVLQLTTGAVVGTLADGWGPAIAAAREQLSANNIPAGDRYLAVAPDVVTAILSSAVVTSGNMPWAGSALTEANIGRYLGFQVVESNFIPAGTAFAFHESAVGAIFRTPVAPRGATVGSASWNGYTSQLIYSYDNVLLADVLTCHTLFGLGTSTATYDLRNIKVTLA